MGRKINIEIGQIFTYWTILSREENLKGRSMWLCKCKCGEEKIVIGSNLTNESSKSCGCLQKETKNSQWTGVGEISGGYWYEHVIRSANGSKGRKEKECNITKEYMWDLFLLQNRKCALSGIELSFPNHGKDSSYTASIDRIDSSLGYIEGNVQWVHKDINIMKNKFDQAHFINLCNLISKTQVELVK